MGKSGCKSGTELNPIVTGPRTQMRSQRTQSPVVLYSTWTRCTIVGCQPLFYKTFFLVALLLMFSSFWWNRGHKIFSKVRGLQGKYNLMQHLQNKTLKCVEISKTSWLPQPCSFMRTTRPQVWFKFQLKMPCPSIHDFPSIIPFPALGKGMHRSSRM